jgi:ribosomal protein S12 methylthiotransferase
VSSKILSEKKPRTVALVTLGCARNETDSEELAGRLAADGWQLVTDPADAEIAVINTCGFIESAKKDSIDALSKLTHLKQMASLKQLLPLVVWQKDMAPNLLKR